MQVAIYVAIICTIATITFSNGDLRYMKALLRWWNANLRWRNANWGWNGVPACCGWI